MSSHSLGRRLLVARVALLPLVALSGCGDPTPPPPLVPAAIQALFEVPTGAVVAEPLAMPPAVRITTEDGRPVPNVDVTFVVAAGGGSIEGSTTTTNDAGIARVGGWTLGTSVGVNTLKASVANLPPATFSVTSVPAPAYRLVVVTAPSATVRNRVPFPVQPVLRLVDRYDNQVHDSGVRVAASLTGGNAAGEIYDEPSTYYGYPSVETVDGVATFTKLAIRGSVASFLIAFSAPNLLAASARVDVGAGDPKALGVFTANSATATVGTVVATPPTVVVEDADRNRVEGIPVTFFVIGGGGSVTGATLTTSSTGLATLGSWRLGTTVGTNTLSVVSSAIPGVTLTLTATGLAGPPATMAAIGGNNETAIAGSVVIPLPAVRLRDQYGNDVPNVPVTFSITSGDGYVGETGSLKTTSISTGPDGAATVRWRVGTVAGTNTLTATVASSLPPIVFTATGVPGPPASFVFATAPSSTAVNRALFAQQPVLHVRDANGNFVRETIRYFVEMLSFYGERLYGTTSITTSNGIAAFTDLSIGGPVGSYTLYFQGTGLSSSLTATVVTTPGPAAEIQYDAGNAQRGPVGQPLPNPLRVKVHDGDGNGVRGIAVKFEIVNGGGSITGADQMTGEDGTASVGSWTLGPNPGGNQLNAIAQGLTGSPVVFFATGEPRASASTAPGVRQPLHR